MVARLDDYIFNEINDFMNIINKTFSRYNEYPFVRIYENDDNFIFKFEVPGISTESINIEVENDILNISFDKPFEEIKDTKVIRNEINYGKFVRNFQLPVKVDVDRAVADYKNGVLTLNLPKAEEAKPKKIAIKKE